MFGIFGVVMLAILVLAPPEELWQLGALVLITGMLFFGFGGYLYTIYGMGREEEPVAPDAAFQCRHCGKRFSDEKVWKLHERSCVEMRI